MLKKIYPCWFFNNAINVPLMDKGPIFKIFHEYNLVEFPPVNVDNLLSNYSSQFKICAIINSCVLFFYFFFFFNFGIGFRPMFLLESTALLCTDVI